MTVPTISARFRALLSRIFRARIWPLAIIKIPRQLARLLISWISKLLLGWKGGSGGPSALSQDNIVSRSKKESGVQEDLTSLEPPESGLPHEPGHCTITPNGHTISFEGISTSACPLANNNIRQTASLPSLRSTDISQRRRPGSPAGFELQAVVPNDRRHPALLSQYSLSAPEINLQSGTPEQNDSPSSNIQVASAEESAASISERDTQASLPVPSTTPSNNHYRLTRSDNPADDLILEVDRITTNDGPNDRPSHPLPPFSDSHSLHSQPEANARDSSSPYERTTFESPSSPPNNHLSSRPEGQSASDEVGQHSSDLRIDPPPFRVLPRIPSQYTVSDERYIRPVFPMESRRYCERTRILKRETELTFPPITLDFSKPVPPAGWIRYAHPDGSRYFYNKERNVYTDTEIYDPDFLSYLEEKIDQLKTMSIRFPNPFPETGEFVINAYRTPDGGMQSEYYCVDHHTRLVFFLKTMLGSWAEAWAEAPGVTSPAQFCTILVLRSAISKQ